MGEERQELVVGKWSAPTIEQRWGEAITLERAHELDNSFRFWASHPDLGSGITDFGPFTEHTLTGADASYLAARALAGGIDADTQAMENASDTLNILQHPESASSLSLWATSNVTLSALNLKGAYFYQAHLEGAFLREAHLEGTRIIGAHLEDADLRNAYLQRANLDSSSLEHAHLEEAHLENTSLEGVHFEGAFCRSAILSGASLRGASFSRTSRLNEVILTGARFDQVSFDNTNLTVIDWNQVITLGDEHIARKAAESQERLVAFKGAVRANRLLAVALETQGMVEDANRFAYRAQHLQRHVLRLQRRRLSFLGSALLDILAGYGYKPSRSLLAYAVLVIFFAGIYWWLIAAGLSAEHLRSWADPLVLSVTSFHGRAFFAGDLHLDDWVARVGAVEAAIGLLIEVIFIATFTQRFFGTK